MTEEQKKALKAGEYVQALQALQMGEVVKFDFKEIKAPASTYRVFASVAYKLNASKAHNRRYRMEIIPRANIVKIEVVPLISKIEN